MPRFDPLREVAAPYGLTCVRWTPTHMTRSDKHREVEVNLMLEGSVRYGFGGKITDLLKGELAIFWGDVPHQIVDFSSDCAYYVLTIPIADFMQWQLPEPFVKAILHGEVMRYPSCPTRAVEAERFCEWEADLLSEDLTRLSACRLEIQARLLRWSAVSSVVSRESGDPGSKGELLRAEQIAQFINENATDRLSARLIADHFGLHPNSVMRIFRRAYGCTLVEYITEVRLFRAQRLLATTNDLIELIALESGFGSMSRFNQAFRSKLGCSPREYRNSARPAP